MKYNHKDLGINTSYLIILLLLLSPVLLVGQTPCESLYGVWKYETKGLEGMNILTPNHYIWIFNQKNRIDFNGSKPSLEEKANAFDNMTVSAGTWECNGNRATVHQKYAKDPALVDSSFSFDFNIIGDKGDYWVIDAGGNRAPKGVARKVAEWDEPSSCSKLNGVWTYEGMKGMSIQSGIYGAWVIVDPDQGSLAADLTTASGKSRAFEAIEAHYAIADCKGDHRTQWVIIHSVNPAMEKKILYTEIQVQKNSFSGRFMDTNRRLIGEEWKMIRLE